MIGLVHTRVIVDQREHTPVVVDGGGLRAQVDLKRKKEGGRLARAESHEHVMDDHSNCFSRVATDCVRRGSPNAFRRSVGSLNFER